MNQVVLLGFILKKAVLISKTLSKHFLRSVICVNSLPSVRIYGFVNILVARFCCLLSWKITRNSWKSLRKVLESFLQIPPATLMHCVKIARIRSYSGLHFPAFGLNTDRYPRITPNTNTFNRVLCFIGQKMVRYAWNSSQRRKTKNGNTCWINIIFDFQIVITVFSSKCFLFLNVNLNFRFFY